MDSNSDPPPPASRSARPPSEIVVGADFGVPKTAGEQAKKIILIESERVSGRTYVVRADGRNERLVRKPAASDDWKRKRRGWTVPDLATSLATDRSVTVAAFDFPFSIPLGLLQSAAFAARMNRPTFETRSAWAAFVASELSLTFGNDSASGMMGDLGKFAPWRDKAFWTRHNTDRDTNGSPPLKHKFQNLFSMTLAGTALIERLRAGGMSAALSSAEFVAANRYIVETYPAQVSRSVGITGRYKRDPEASIVQAERYLRQIGISVDVDPAVRQFCVEYRTGSTDPDGADAFLCLVAAICFREGSVRRCSGPATTADLEQEGCIIVPTATP